MRVRNLKQLAEAINKMGDVYKATVIPSWSNTDSEVAGMRLKRPGKGRYGLKIFVKDITRSDEVVFEYDTSVCYNTLREAVTQAIGLFGDSLNVDPDEVFPVGVEVRVGQLIGKVVGMTMRGKTRRVKTYQIRLYRTNTVQEIESRDVFSV